MSPRGTTARAPNARPLNANTLDATMRRIDLDADAPADPRQAADAYAFRGLVPHVRFGTASDRYAGWIGQIYPEHLRGAVSTRSRRLAGETYEERTLPVDSVRYYFEHCGVLELDFTFYRPLREADGEPSSTFFVLQQYAEAAPADAAFLVKAPQQYFARTLRRRRDGRTRYEANPDFLDLDAYVRRFHEPAVELLGERLRGILFQQEYQRVGESPSPRDNAVELDAFFRRLPEGVQAHLELRSEHLLQPPYFDWLAHRGLGHVFSHWTWLPPIRRQWRLGGERFTAANGEVVARLLTPLGTKYADAYALAHPFDRAVPEIAETEQARDMVLDATALVFQAQQQDALLNLIANNRAWGNSPDLLRAVAHRVLDHAAARG